MTLAYAVVGQLELDRTAIHIGGYLSGEQGILPF